MPDFKEFSLEEQRRQQERTANRRIMTVRDECIRSPKGILRQRGLFLLGIIKKPPLIFLNRL